MPDIGETGTRHQANITGTDDCKIHDRRNGAGESAAAQVAEQIQDVPHCSQAFVHCPWE
jgi:hypothetical protein